MTPQEAEIQRVQDAVTALSEHFDTVQIFVTIHRTTPEGDLKEGTTSINRGYGNWYARHGQINEWMVRADADARRDD